MGFLSWLFLVASLIITLLFFFYGYNAYYLLAALRRYRAPAPRAPGGRLPTVAVHLPVYNERYVVRRLLGACGRMAREYDPEKVRIIVIDDSDDDTSAVIDQEAREQRRGGIRVEVMRRKGRQGFKAGALQAALEETREELVAIFDADFLPPSNFLVRAAAPLVQDQGLGVVQAR